MISPFLREIVWHASETALLQHIAEILRKQ